MKILGKFILFHIDEFRDYLDENDFKREIKLIQNHHTYIPSYSQFKGKLSLV